MPETYYVGLSATMHDPAMAIVDANGEVLFAEALERPLQDKRAWNQAPDHMHHTIRVIDRVCGPESQIVVGVSWSRRLLDRLRWLSAVRTRRLDGWLGRWIEYRLSKRDHLVWPTTSYAALLQSLSGTLLQTGSALRWHGRLNAPIRYFDHHLAHATYASSAAPFDHAHCVIIDGFGENASTACFRFEAGRLSRLSKRANLRDTPASLGMFYGFICELCGYSPTHGEEWKVMGLAPLGNVDGRLHELLTPLLQPVDDGLAQDISSDEFIGRLRAAQSLSLKPADIAATGQMLFCDWMSTVISNVYQQHGPMEHLILSGGCALNSACNGTLLQTTPFRRLFVPPAPADDGNAVGAALLAWKSSTPESRLRPAAAASPFLGSTVAPLDLDRLRRYGTAGFRVTEQPTDTCIASRLAEGRIVARVSGRAEFGPRALGNRSILADPRSAAIRTRINAKVKFREAFRPFAPAVLDEAGSDFFSDYVYTPYMERALRFRAEVRDAVPAVVHADGTGRLQSVTSALNPGLHAIIKEFEHITGVPMLLNTSLNRMGKPIAHSVDDAISLFLASDIDILVIEDLMLEKK